MYELRLFMAKVFPLLIQAHYDQYHIKSLWYDPDSNPRPPLPEPGLLLLSQISMVLNLLTFLKCKKICISGQCILWKEYHIPLFRFSKKIKY